MESSSNLGINLIKKNQYEYHGWKIWKQELEDGLEGLILKRVRAKNTVGVKIWAEKFYWEEELNKNRWEENWDKEYFFTEYYNIEKKEKNFSFLHVERKRKLGSMSFGIFWKNCSLFQLSLALNKNQIPKYSKMSALWCQFLTPTYYIWNLKIIVNCY